ELGAVADQPVEGKFVRDLQRKQAQAIEPAAERLGLEWIARIERCRHLRAKSRYERAPIRGQRIRQLQSADAPDRRFPMRAEMVEIHAERIGVSPEVPALDMQPYLVAPQSAELDWLAGDA